MLGLAAVTPEGLTDPRRPSVPPGLARQAPPTETHPQATLEAWGYQLEWPGTSRPPALQLVSWLWTVQHPRLTEGGTGQGVGAVWGPSLAGCNRLTQLHRGASSKDLGCEVPVGPLASPVEGAAGGQARCGSPNGTSVSTPAPAGAPTPTLNAPRRPQLCPDARERLLELSGARAPGPARSCGHSPCALLGTGQLRLDQAGAE